MVADLAPLALLLIASAAGSMSLSALFATTPPAVDFRLLETTIGTTFFCASVGMIFHLFGPAAGAGSLALSWLSNWTLSGKGPRLNSLCAWISAAAFLASVKQV